MNKQRKRLTDARLRSLKPKDQRYEVWDIQPGFGVRIAPSGRKSFVFLYRFRDKPRRLTIGVYPRVTLADAREQVAIATRKIEKGLDPGTEKIMARRDLADSDSFTELAHHWVERWAKPNRKGWKEAQRQLEADAIPAWAHRKVHDISRYDVITLIEKIMDRGSPIMANRTLGLLKQVFKFGVQRGVIDSSPAIDIDKPARERRSDRVLADAEIKLFWERLDQAMMTDDVRIALKLCLITAQRRGEIAGMRRSEINEDWWTIPKERSKNNKAHRVPLSPLAQELIATASGDDFLFPSTRKRGPNGQAKPIEPRALTNAVSKNRPRVIGDEPLWNFPRFCVHDLRRTAATKIAQLGVSRFDIGKILNHSDRDVTAIYDHYDYDTEKRQAMLKWDERLQLILAGKTIADVGNTLRRP